MKDISDIKFFLEHLKEMVGENLVALVIYGSVACNEQDEFSDIDVCVILENKDELTIKKIREVMSQVRDKNYFIFPIEKDELEKNILAGDVFCKHEVIRKGSIIHERKGYVSNLKKEMELIYTDFQAAEELHRERYNADKTGLFNELQNILDRLRWGYTDLICMRLALIKLEPHCVEEYALLMNTDEVLYGFVDDFKKILKINKEYQHHKTDFPFNKLEYFCKRLMELEHDVLNISS